MLAAGPPNVARREGRKTRAVIGFIVYVEDCGEPGAGIDRFWLETNDKDGNVIPDLSMERDATDNATTIEGGNIVAPH